MQFLGILICTLFLVVGVLFNMSLLQTTLSTDPIAPERTKKISWADLRPTPLSENSEQIVETYTRPIFSSSRRKYIKPPATIPNPKPKLAVLVEPVVESRPVKKKVVRLKVNPPNVKILGFQTSPKQSAVLIYNRKEATSKWLKKGEQIEKWTISTISRNQLILKSGDQQHTLKLYPDNQ